MAGIYNTIGHETEPLARQGSAELMEAISQLYMMLAALERGDLGAATNIRANVVSRLQSSAGIYDNVAAQAGTYPLSLREDNPFALELTNLYSRLGDFDYRMPLSNRGLPQIAALEIRKFAGVVTDAVFHGSVADWRTFRYVIDAATRLLSVGLVVSRISALHGHGLPPNSL